MGRELLPNRLLVRVSGGPEQRPAVLVSVELRNLFVLSLAWTRITPDAGHRESSAMIAWLSLSPAAQEPLGAFGQFPHHVAG
jgi:hypothetical protein